MNPTDLNYGSDVAVKEIPTSTLKQIRINVSSQAAKLYDELRLIDAELRRREVTR